MRSPTEQSGRQLAPADDGAEHGAERNGKVLLVFVSIPLMVLAVAIATVPIIIAMRKEAVEQRQALQPPLSMSPAVVEGRRAA